MAITLRYFRGRVHTFNIVFNLATEAQPVSHVASQNWLYMRAVYIAITHPDNMTRPSNLGMHQK